MLPRTIASTPPAPDIDLPRTIARLHVPGATARLHEGGAGPR
ncbi:hypothetical protein PQJ75_11690 [Rhodoplanes sp. TEM]|uniref:AraC family transcriptional regulator n=1 Tax=Rhodoplanes tepidamans TaxID=200616 RepID=A0ABT5JHZ8_RHOTP|nr:MULTISPECIES: hypothetical protein [Rhodoplanes]MDC7788660.1 hypothetical protein [Rhodoplanes tepidamans]MDC7984394.1 hypothetical protein [Rhodoplanes sp. TEM]MDQ0358336.1 hypothetical protein [Rhodoplanes tepidamans]